MSASVSLSMAELRDKGLVSGGGSEPLEIEKTVFRVKRFDRDASQVVRTDEHGFPAYMEQPRLRASAVHDRGMR